MNLQLLYRQAGVIWQHEAEFLAFLEFIRHEKVRSILEIGTGFGGSAWLFGEATHNGRVVTVDFDAAGAARVDPRKRRRQTNPNFVQVTGDSRTDAIEAVIAAHAPFDLVYFDTEHPYENCVDNFARYGKMATRFVAQHDINMDEVNWPDAGIPRFWRELKATHPVAAEFIAPAHDPRFPRWGGIGVVHV